MRIPAAFVLVACLGAMPGAVRGASAQDSQREIRDSQLRLEQIRREREDLQREMNTLRTRLTDTGSQIVNIERRVLSSTEALGELEFQAEALERGVEETTGELVRSRDRLLERKVLLNTRLRSIYKRGTLHPARVILGAESFGDLIRRYKYLHLIASYDQTLIGDVGRLERQLSMQERELTRDLNMLQELRAERLEEIERLRVLEREQQNAMRGLQQREVQAMGRLQRLAQDEARLTSLVANLERRRLEEQARLSATTGSRTPISSSLTTASLGALDWPVEGDILYRFGPERRPNGVTLRWNGIGIAARPGTPVRAVEAGTTVMAGRFEGYGPSVMISHGGGYYTLYLYLATVTVGNGQQIAARQVIGTVGGEQTPEGAHIEFQIRAPARVGGSPEPIDPLNWLRARARP